MNLHKLFDAQSIAVVGASPKPSSFGGVVLKNLVDMGYPGQLCAIHPKATEVHGQPVFTSLTDMPYVPDCIALAVANHHLLRMLTEAGELGIPSAVVFGDPTVGAGRAPELEGQIADLAAQFDMAIIGANAMGYYALHRKLVVSGYPVDPEKPAGNVALITHSGTVFDSFSQNNRAVNFNYVISAGNETVLNASDYLRHVLDDPATKVVAMYLETVRDPQGFLMALQVAAERRIPIVALKTGLSERGQAMAQAHTGALAGGAEAYAAIFKHYGVHQVFTLDEMMDTVELFSNIQYVDVDGVSALMESGGERSMFVDHATNIGVTLATLSDDTNARLAEVLEEGVAPDNPLDAFGSGHDVVATYRDCMLAMAADDATGLMLLAVDLARDSYLSHDYVEATLAAQPDIKKPLAALVNLTAGANDELMATLRANGVPVLMGTDTGLKAIRHLVHHSQYQQPAAFAPIGQPSADVVSNIRQQLADANSALDEAASKAILAHWGLPVVSEQVVDTADDALATAQSMGYPVVLKTAAENVLHKSDAGGIVLNIQNDAQLQAAYAELAARLGQRALVQPMAPKGQELLLGMKNDPQFGPLLVVGLGGIFVEIYKDVVTSVPQLEAAQVQSLLESLQGYPLLAGARGQSGVAMDVLIDTVMRFATFIQDIGDVLSEVDINPLIMTSEQGYIVDALLIPK